MSDPIVIDPAVYWKLRALSLQHQQLIQQLQEQELSSKRALDAVLVEAGLATNTTYQLNDSDCSAVRPETHHDHG